MDKLIINKAQCKICGSIIMSENVNNMVRCNCGRIAVDGGHEYIKRVGDVENIIELSTQINLEELKDLNDFKELIDDLEECDKHINKINENYQINFENALKFANKTYSKYVLSEPEISLLNSNPFPTTNDNRTQLIINLNAVKRIIIQTIIKKEKEITNESDN